MEIQTQEMTENAEQKLSSIQGFREEISLGLEPILRDLKSLRNRFPSRVYQDGDQSEMGVLTNALSDYLDCITVDTDRLDRMLAADEQAWANNLEQTKKQAEVI